MPLIATLALTAGAALLAHEQEPRPQRQAMTALRPCAAYIVLMGFRRAIGARASVRPRPCPRLAVRAR